MNKFIFGGVLLVSLFASYSVMASPIVKKGHNLNFRGDITASMIVGKTCIIKAKKQGKLVPNRDMTRLISYGNGGKAGSFTVTTGRGIKVELTASRERLTRDGVPVENVNLESGFGREPVGLGNELWENVPSLPIKQGVKNKELHVWFEAVRTSGEGISVFDTAPRNTRNAIFEAGTYTGLTTITCQPYTVDRQPES